MSSIISFIILDIRDWFIKKYENASDKLFILDYKDDLISVICYRMLKNLQNVSPFKFNIASLSSLGMSRKSSFFMRSYCRCWG